MPNYKPYNLDQMKLIPVNFHRQIQPGSFEFTLHALIEDDIELSVFDRHTRTQKRAHRRTLRPYY
jgi:hypothetical protein